MAKIELVGIKAETAPEVGDFFVEKNSQEIYILAQISGSEYILICLNDGKRWLDAENHSSKLFRNIDGTAKTFVKIETPFTITPES